MGRWVSGASCRFSLPPLVPTARSLQRCWNFSVTSSFHSPRSGRSGDYRGQPGISSLFLNLLWLRGRHRIVFFLAVFSFFLAVDLPPPFRFCTNRSKAARRKKGWAGRNRLGRTLASRRHNRRWLPSSMHGVPGHKWNLRGERLRGYVVQRRTLLGVLPRWTLSRNIPRPSVVCMGDQ